MIYKFIDVFITVVGWLLLDIGWFVLFLYIVSFEQYCKQDNLVHESHLKQKEIHRY